MVYRFLAPWNCVQCTSFLLRNPLSVGSSNQSLLLQASIFEIRRWFPSTLCPFFLATYPCPANNCGSFSYLLPFVLVWSLQSNFGDHIGSVKRSHFLRKQGINRFHFKYLHSMRNERCWLVSGS